MPRRLRIAVPGIPWHIVQRGINRNACVFDSKITAGILIRCQTCRPVSISRFMLIEKGSVTNRKGVGDKR